MSWLFERGPPPPFTLRFLSCLRVSTAEAGRQRRDVVYVSNETFEAAAGPHVAGPAYDGRLAQGWKVTAVLLTLSMSAEAIAVIGLVDHDRVRLDTKLTLGFNPNPPAVASPFPAQFRQSTIGDVSA